MQASLTTDNDRGGIDSLPFFSDVRQLSWASHNVERHLPNASKGRLTARAEQHDVLVLVDHLGKVVRAT